MFANTKFTRQQMPAFKDRSRFVSDGQPSVHSCVKTYIFNDGDEPPKPLIAIDIFSVPPEDMEKKNWESTCYDIDAYVGLLPEDAIKLARTITMLVSEIFNEGNYMINEKMNPSTTLRRQKGKSEK